MLNPILGLIDKMAENNLLLANKLNAFEHHLDEEVQKVKRENQDLKTELQRLRNKVETLENKVTL